MIVTRHADLVQCWAELGLARDHLLLCHSSLPVLGRIEDGPATVVASILEAIGPNGTLIVPTFTYSFFGNQVYEPSVDPSQVGVLGDIVRGWPGAIRSLDPNFSNAGIGPFAADLLNWNGEPSIGRRSFYDKFIAARGFVLLLGVDFRSLPLFMHLEAALDVSYRYAKTFDGFIRTNGALCAARVVHMVRDERVEPQSDRSRIGAVIESDPECRMTSVGYGVARFVPAQAVERAVRRMLALDPCFLLDPHRPFLKDPIPDA